MESKSECSSKKILVAEDLLYKNGIIEEIDISSALKKFNMQGWSEQLTNTSNLKFDQNHLNARKIIDTPTYNNIVNQIEINNQKQVITKMPAELGYGIFAAEDIKEHESLGIYAGEIKVFPLNEYQGDVSYFLNLYTPEKASQIFIDAKSIGNITRFYQHLPSTNTEEKNLLNANDYVFKSAKNGQNLATANVEVVLAQYNNFYFPVIQSIVPIKKGEIIGFDYGEYWLTQRKIPVLFNKNGSLISCDSYQFNKCVLRVPLINKRAADFGLPGDYLKDRYFEIDIFVENQDLKISKEEFKNAQLQVPAGSPHLYIDKYRQKKLVKKNTSTPSSLKSGFFTGKVKATIPQELERITQLDGWKYDQKKNVAFLEDKNSQTIAKVFSLLKNNDFEVKKGKNQKNGNSLMYLYNPILDKLAKTSILTEEVAILNV